jgi:hypothetical protein
MSWNAAPTSKGGRQPVYSDAAIQSCLIVKLLFGLAHWAVEVEIFPVERADFIARNTRVNSESSGCEAARDTQYLLSSDTLGTCTGHCPRQLKHYADLAAGGPRVHAIRVAAFRTFAADVRMVIPPFLAGCGHRTHAAIFSFWAGVMPPMPMFGRSLL